MQEERAEYPKPVQDLFNMAGVLHAVPYDGTPIIKDGKNLPLMPEPSHYQWSKDGKKLFFLCLCSCSLEHQTL